MRLFERLFIYSNIWVALGATSLGAWTFRSLQQPIQPYVLGFLFFSTLFIYNFSRLYSIRHYKPEFPSRRLLWMRQNIQLVKLLLLLSAILGALCFFVFANPNAVLLMLIAGALSLLYSIPVGQRSGFRGLRDLPFAKIFLIAFTWLISTQWLPKTQIENLSLMEVVLSAPHLSFERFAFIFLLCLPFDLRDSEFDQAMRVTTLPNKLGVTTTNLLLLFTCTFLAMLFFTQFPKLWLVGVFYIALCPLLLWAGRQKADLVFYGLVDGLMIAQPFLFLGMLNG